MRISQQITIRLLTGFLAILSISCRTIHKQDFWPDANYLVDNPLEVDIVIKVDEQEYNIPAKSSKTIMILPGKHTLTYNESSVKFINKIKTVNKPNQDLIIINPTLSNYILKAQYKNGHSAGAGFQVKVLNMLFIEKAHHEWSYGLNESGKSKPQIKVPKEQLILYKLYREQDYREIFDKNPSANLVIPVIANTLNELSNYKFPTDSLLGDCLKANTYVSELEKKWNELISNPQYLARDVSMLKFDYSSRISKEILKECSEDHMNTINKIQEVLNYLNKTNVFIVK